LTGCRRETSFGARSHPFIFEDAMRAETESVVNDIRESLALLRRHL
jgi:hypothetical protein